MSEATRKFYDEQGWKVSESGRHIDGELFGVREDGPIRKRLHECHVRRVTDFLAGTPLNLLEVGCGGNPADFLFPLCSRYTGCDFSVTGIDLSRKTHPTREFHVADARDLPFETGKFDAVYSSHMIYHIADENDQAKVIREIVRVVRPGGRIVMIFANARPLGFPIRLARRVIADSPVGPWLNRHRTPPLPFNPRPRKWMLRQFAAAGADANAHNYAIPSTAFNQRVTEFGILGRTLWRMIEWLDTAHPKLSRTVGCYSVITATVK